MYFAIFLVWLLFGLISARAAGSRGRKPLPWFFIGFFFGILGLCALFFSPIKFFKKPRRRAAAVAVPTLSQKHKDKFWYYLDPSNQQFGPMSFNALNKAWKSGEIHAETYVWNEELDQWKKLAQFIQQ